MEEIRIIWAFFIVFCRKKLERRFATSRYLALRDALSPRGASVFSKSAEKIFKILESADDRCGQYLAWKIATPVQFVAKRIVYSVARVWLIFACLFLEAFALCRWIEKMVDEFLDFVPKWCLRPMLAVVYSASAIILLVVLLLLYVRFWTFGLDAKLDFFLNFSPAASVQILDEDKSPLAELPGIESYIDRIPYYRHPVNVGEIPQVMTDALLAAEDKRFFSHRGIDKIAVLRAGAHDFWVSIKSRSISFSRGASGWTQQMVKQVFLRDQFEREQRGGVGKVGKFFRKIEEIRYSIWLERELPKRYKNLELAKIKIMEVFATMGAIGHGQYGVASGARFYFGKELREIEGHPEEAAMLAGLLQNPNGYSPINNLNVAKGRRDLVLELMAELPGKSNEERQAYREAKKMPIKLAVQSPREKLVAPSAMNYIIKTLWGSQDNPMITWENGAIVESTISRAHQIAANGAVEFGLEEYRKRHQENAKKIQVALVVMHNDGRISALVGGANPKYQDFNRISAHRQPGSSIKPLVNFAALRNGRRVECTRERPDCDVFDREGIRIQMGGGRTHEINNYDHRYFGMIQLWQCMAESRNACTMWLAGNISPKGMKESLVEIKNAANLFGMYEDAKLYPTIALGAEEVTPIQLTAMYAAFLNGGYRVVPTVIKRVTSPEGGLKEERLFREPIMDTPVFEGMATLLRHAVLWQSGTGRSLSNLPNWEGKIGLPIEVGGKTGTTDNFKDAWFCGGTYGEKGITACVWVGFDDNTFLTDPAKCKPLDAEGRKYCESGAVVALPIFKKFMELAFVDSYPEPFPKHINDRVLGAHKYGKVPSRSSPPQEKPVGIKIDVSEKEKKVVIPVKPPVVLPPASVPKTVPAEVPDEKKQ